MITGEDIDNLYAEQEAPNIDPSDSVRETRRTGQMMRVNDPTRMGMPALTSLLFSVCNNNHRVFEEATRLVHLFMDQAEADALETVQKMVKED